MTIHNAPYFRQTKGGGIWDREKKSYFQTSLPYHIVKNTTISRAGCGLCASASALWWATGVYVDPTTLMDRFAGSGGSYHNILGYEAGKRGLKTEYLETISEVVKAIKSGAVVMSLQKKGAFTSGSGHYILLVGVTDDGRICVNDSASQARSYFASGRTYLPSTIDKYAKKTAGIYYTAVWPAQDRKLTAKVRTVLNIWTSPVKSRKLGYIETGTRVIVTDPEPNGGFLRVMKRGKVHGAEKYPVKGYCDMQYLRLERDGHWV